MFLKGHYQNAYVTHDLDRAVDLASRHLGIEEFMTFEPELVLQSPTGEKRSGLRVALAWVGGLQIELIQPVYGYRDQYDPFLPADRSDATPRFHHFAVRRDDEAAMREEFAHMPIPMLLEGEMPGLKYAYFDARASLGHIIEYVCTTPEDWDTIMGWPKGLLPI